MLVSIIIPHKGRADLLEKTCQSIAAQSHDTSKIEVIIVTQSGELTQQIKLPANLPEIKIYQQDRALTISALRNYGVSRSTGSYLAFLDADVYLSANWLNAMIQLLQDSPQRSVVSAVQINGDNAPVLERIRTCLSNVSVDTSVAFLPGRNLFMKRSVFTQVGGFPDHLTTCEDYYFTDKAAQIGELYYSSSATYIHLGEDKVFADMFKKEIWRSQSNLQSISGRKIPLREWPSILVPLAIAVLWLLAIGLMISGHWLAAAAAFLTGMLPVFVYSVRLYLQAGDSIGLTSIMKFYAYYFPARAIGTVKGISAQVLT